jgi:EAL domain-containing protein (putative c-di-GMP-specific phosphodiesterase class I)
MSVNVSPRQLDDERFVADVADALADSGLPAERLMLEVTEGVFVRDMELAVQRLRAVRDLGVRIALDDFGTGYCSLAYLRSLPLDVLKIGQPFVDRLAPEPDDPALAHTIITLAQSLGLTTIGEAVELRHQAERLRDLGCDLGQGYLYARPLPLDAFHAHLGLTAGGPATPPGLRSARP